MTTTAKTPANRHRIAIAVIVLIGLAAGSALVWWPQPGGAKHEEQAAGAASEHGHGHSHEAAHDEDEHHGQAPKAAHSDAAEHGDAEHHEDEKGKAGQEAQEGKEHAEEKAAPAQVAAEGETLALSEAQIQAAGIALEAAGAGAVQQLLQLPGEVRLNQDRSTAIVPRLAAVVESVAVSQGQTVKKGQVLAQLASPEAAELRSQWQAAPKRLGLAQNTYAREKRLWEEKITAEQDYRQAEQSWQEAQITLSAIGQKLSALGLDAGAASGSLNRFALRAPFDGVVIEKNLSLGQALKDDAAVFVVADLRQVWVELQVPAQALPQLKVGELVQVQASAFSAQAKGKIAFVGSLLGEQTRTATARVVLDNAQGQWRPGLFVNVAVAASQEQAPVTVRNEALQTVEGKTVVFVRTAQGFAARPVELGISDGVRSAVKKGLQAGERYAAVGSFVLKAELGKSEAAHEH